MMLPNSGLVTLSVLLAAILASASDLKSSYFKSEADDCEGATDLGMIGHGFNMELTGSTEFTTYQSEEARYCGRSIGTQGVWYTFLAEEETILTASLCGSSFDTRIAILTGEDCGPSTLVCATMNDDTDGCAAGGGSSFGSQTELVVKPAVTYRIFVSGYSHFKGDYVLNLSTPDNKSGTVSPTSSPTTSPTASPTSSPVQQLAPPKNDHCEDAQDLGVVGNDFSLKVMGSTEFTEYQSQEARYCGLYIGTQGVWYKFQAQEETFLTASLRGSSFDTRIAILVGAECGAEEDLICASVNDDTEGCAAGGHDNFGSHTEIEVQPGMTYRIFVAGYSDFKGDYVLSLSTRYV